MSLSEEASFLDLESIRQRCEAATPGPWDAKCVHVFMDGRGQYRIGPKGPGGFRGDVFVHDAEFIAHARTDIPALIAEIERLRGR